MIILAGGLGTRLRSVLKGVPKPMAPVNGRPFLEYQLDYWISQGISRFILSVGFMSKTIRDHFGDAYLDFPIEYIEESEPLGTGGALKLVLDNVKFLNQRVLLINGDTWYRASLPKLVLDSENFSTPLVMAVREVKVNDRYSAITLDENNNIINFGISSSGSCRINAGCYLLDIKNMSKLMALQPRHFSFEQDFLPSFAKKIKIKASIQNEEFLDIGVPHDYYKAEDILNNHK